MWLCCEILFPKIFMNTFEPGSNRRRELSLHCLKQHMEPACFWAIGVIFFFFMHIEVPIFFLSGTGASMFDLVLSVAICTLDLLVLLALICG